MLKYQVFDIVGHAVAPLESTPLIFKALPSLPIIVSSNESHRCFSIARLYLIIWWAQKPAHPALRADDESKKEIR